MLEEYRAHTNERYELGIPPKPLSAEQVAGLVELLKSPPAGEGDYLINLITEHVPPGVDEAAYVKAAFLAAVAYLHFTSNSTRCFCPFLRWASTTLSSALRRFLLPGSFSLAS